ncbi:MAG: hypothetical protein ACKVYV_11065 [Limisphaerales bacterium]
MPSARLRKLLLAALAAAALVGASFMQDRLLRDRDELGLTRTAALENAPPLLAFTTVALGGFRGLVANSLWIRMSQLQEDGKYFEMVQLSDWLTKLTPTVAQVWIHLAWNMAYNVSVQIPDLPARWPWVRRGIELLRDEGLRYNPHNVAIYRELAWLYQHKMGADLDDAHWVYKREWAAEMSPFFGGAPVDWARLTGPQSEEDRLRARALRELYKIDPLVAQKVDERYGPLDWRLPETHAIYWGFLGLENARTEEQLIQLRRVIFQSMQLAFRRGRLTMLQGVKDGDLQRFEIGPNLGIVDKVDLAFTEMMRDDGQFRDNIGNAYKNFLRDATYFLYTHNREAEARRWFDRARQSFTNAIPDGMTLDDYAVSRVTEVAGDTGRDRTTLILEGLIGRSFYNLAVGDQDQAVSFDRLARRVWERYMKETEFKTIRGNEQVKVDRVLLDPLPVMKSRVASQMLDPENGLEPLFAANLRLALNLPAGTTNVPPPAVTTNAPAAPPPP